MYFSFLVQQTNTPSGVATGLIAGGNGMKGGGRNNRPSEKAGHSWEIVLHAGLPGVVSQSQNAGIKPIPKLQGQQMGNNRAIMSKEWLTSCAPQGRCVEKDNR